MVYSLKSGGHQSVRAHAVAVIAALIVAASLPLAAEAPEAPVRVCEILREINSYLGRPVPVVGRFSFRQNGRMAARYLNEEKCQSGGPSSIRIEFDSKSAPRPPQDFALDSAATYRLLSFVQKQTALGKFRFGTQDYDRWAIVYGRLEPLSGDSAGGASAVDRPAARLVVGGDGDIVFLGRE